MKKLYEEPTLDVTKFSFNYSLLDGSLTNPEATVAPGDNDGHDAGEVPDDWDNL